MWEMQENVKFHLEKSFDQEEKINFEWGQTHFKLKVCLVKRKGLLS